MWNRKQEICITQKSPSDGDNWCSNYGAEKRDCLISTFGCFLLQEPSMRQLHLHVISQDFDSTHLKNKKHWNSFNTAFFRDSVDVMEEVSSNGKAILKDEDSMLSMELRCHRCRSAHPNIPRLKSHVTNCRASFPSTLLQKGRLVLTPCNVSIDA